MTPFRDEGEWCRRWFRQRRETPKTGSLDFVHHRIFGDGHGDSWTNSRDVAAFFGKQHGHVLRDIDNIMKSLDYPKLESPLFIATELPDGSGIDRRSLSLIHI